MKNLRTLCGLTVLSSAFIFSGCDSKPTTDTTPPPAPPAGHQQFSQQKQKMTTPGSATPAAPAPEAK